MMAKKYTERVQNALRECLDEALANSNNIAEPEHLLKAILNDQSSVLYAVLTSKERDDMRNLLIRKIGTFAKMYGCTEPRIGEELYKVLLSAESCKDEYISVNELLLQLLEVKRIKDIVLNFDDIKERIVKYSKDKRFDSKNSDDVTNAISAFAVDMVEQARQNKFDPIACRDEEIRQVLEILYKRSKSSVVLVGPPGVGKTAIVTEIAMKAASERVPTLKNMKIYNVDIGSIVAGTQCRGDFEARLKKLIDEAKSSKVILFIDEIHNVLGAGRTTDGSMDAANMLKPELASGLIKCIGATTDDELRKYVEKDPAFDRRFMRVNVREPSIEDTVTILRGIRKRIEMHYGLKVSDSALVYAARASKYIPNRRRPDIAIDLVETACASAVISLESEPQEIINMKSKLWSLELERASLEIDLQREDDKQQIEEQLRHVTEKIEVVNQDLKPIEEAYLKEKSHVSEAKMLKTKLEDMKLRLSQAERERDTHTAHDITKNVIPMIKARIKELEEMEPIVIAPENVAEIVSRWTGIPVKRLTVKENERLVGMSSKIKERIFGQDEAVEAVVNTILESRIGFGDENKPIGSFLFLGSSGVGKTELARTVAAELFGSEDNMVILDMSEYGSEMSVTKLIGAPAGYVGYNDGGSLTEPVKTRPYNVILLDEIDLAHKSVRNLLYQLMDRGVVESGSGQEVVFRNCLLLMTSNLGQDVISGTMNLSNENKKEIEKIVLEELGPALVNRVDNVIYFNRLNDKDLYKILDYQMNELNKKFASRNIELKLSKRVKEDVISQTSSPTYGARFLKRYLRSNFVRSVTKIWQERATEKRIVVECTLPSEEARGVCIFNYVYRIVD